MRVTFIRLWPPSSHFNCVFLSVLTTMQGIVGKETRDVPEKLRGEFPGEGLLAAS